MRQSKNLIAAINELQILAKSRSSITRRAANFYINLWASKTTLKAVMAAKLVELQERDAARTAKSKAIQALKVAAIIDQAQQKIETLQSADFQQTAKIANNNTTVILTNMDLVKIAANQVATLNQVIQQTTFQNLKNLTTEIGFADFTIRVITKYYREVEYSQLIQTGDLMLITFTKKDGSTAQRIGTTSKIAKDTHRFFNTTAYCGGTPNGQTTNFIEFAFENNTWVDKGFKCFKNENFISAKPLSTELANSLKQTLPFYFVQINIQQLQTA
jgi:hypothetical protein